MSKFAVGDRVRVLDTEWARTQTVGEGGATIVGREGTVSKVVGPFTTILQDADATERTLNEAHLEKIV